MKQIPLADVLAQLREQLAEAERRAAGQDLKLSVKEIEVELHVLTTFEGEGKVGFKVWLIEGEAGGGVGREHGHTIRLKLDPQVERQDGTPKDLNVGSDRKVTLPPGIQEHRTSE